MIIRWCLSFLVIGTYAGFIALILFFFASSPVGIGIFVIMIVFFMGICPMIWGFYYWYGLDRGWLVWTPEVRYPVRKNTLVHGHSLSWLSEHGTTCVILYFSRRTKNQLHSVQFLDRRD
ncbi:hypothetical protein MSAN_00250600 [Mycena sanguinolenta]|uniref:Uncharacterized protein n=1 Tax=Mycena sanguinolenta TaxID=230812 RepID=A0A8H6ZIQ6_9AGAR|nr:hypothetical protein MSAN_00250600 [Mycena sanguinolenta]